MSETTLSDQFQGCSTHPVEDVDLASTIFDLLGNGILQLMRCWRYLVCWKG